MATVVVEHYNPVWPAQFEAIKAALLLALKGVDVIAIEHVGSTSVPDLPAKATIDIDIIVARENMEEAIRALEEKGGYKYIGEMGIPDRHAFRAEQHLLPRRNLYVCVEGCESLLNHLAVRDLLRRDAELRKEYGDVKQRLVAQGLEIDPYCVGKNEIILKILTKAGFDEESRKRIEAANQLP